METNLYSFQLGAGASPEAATVDDLRESLRRIPQDALIEIEKAALIEEAGVRAVATFEALPAGVHQIGDDKRVALVAYVALLLAQHPSMMRRRAAAISQRFWAAAAASFHGDDTARAMFEQADRGHSVFSMVTDQLMLTKELDCLAMHVIRWSGGEGLVLGDTGVVATYPGRPMGVGNAVLPGASFLVPLSPRAILRLGDVRQGLCVVEDRAPESAHAEVAAINMAAWLRAERQVVAATRDDLEAVIETLPPEARSIGRPDQLEIREDALPSFVVDSSGSLEVVEPSSASDYDPIPLFASRAATG